MARQRKNNYGSKESALATARRISPFHKNHLSVEFYGDGRWIITPLTSSGRRDLDCYFHGDSDE